MTHDTTNFNIRPTTFLFYFVNFTVLRSAAPLVSTNSYSNVSTFDLEFSLVFFFQFNKYEFIVWVFISIAVAVLRKCFGYSWFCNSNARVALKHNLRAL